MRKKPKLVVNHLSYCYKRANKQPLQVIDNISLKIFNNEVVSLIGPSGCGKTTIFNIVSGILNEDKGKIEINGLKEKSRRGKCGYMFQEPLLFRWRSVLENVMLGYEIKEMPKQQAKNKALNLLKEFGLFEYANLYSNTLSGGMKQKVALLRTIAFNSSLLLLDEPFGPLDAITRSELHLYLLAIWKKLKLTIILTTHDIREAIFLSDRVYVLSKKPARIIDCLKITLPRPRKLEDLTSEKFVSLEKRLMSLLKQSHNKKDISH